MSVQKGNPRNLQSFMWALDNAGAHAQGRRMRRHPPLQARVPLHMMRRKPAAPIAKHVLSNLQSQSPKNKCMQHKEAARLGLLPPASTMGA